MSVHRPFGVARITVIIAATLLVYGCKQATPAPEPATPVSSTPALMSPSARASAVALASKHPSFKVFLQKVDMPTIIVVPEVTTNEELKALLWHLRIEVQSKHFKQLGLTPTATVFGTPGYSSGAINIYRGEKCAREMYVTSGPDPCGSSIHKAASYHWGDGGDPTADSADIVASTGADDILFTSADNFQTDADATADPNGKLRKAARARIQYATAQNAQQSRQKTDIRFAIADPDIDLRIVSYQLATDAGQKSFLQQFLTLEQDHLCPLGFKTIQLGSLGKPGKPYPIPCH